MKTDKVYVDSRETEKRKKKAKKVRGEENNRIMQLQYGDYVYKDCALEFKTVPDFIGSVKSGRIYNQAIGMNEAYNKTYVVIYGNLTRELKKMYRYRHRFSVKSYLGAIASLSQITHVIHVENESQAFTLAEALFRKSTDGKNRGVKKTIQKSENKLVSCLMMIDGMGKANSEKLIKETGVKTFRELIQLSYDDIVKVPGFGDKTAKNITEYFK